MATYGHPLVWGITLLVLSPRIKAQVDYTPYVFDTLAGAYGCEDGPGSEVRLNLPWGVAVDPAGNVYVSDNSCRILKVAPGLPSIKWTPIQAALMSFSFCLFSKATGEI